MASFDSIVEEATTRGSRGIPGVVLLLSTKMVIQYSIPLHQPQISSSYFTGNSLYTKSPGYTSPDPSALTISPSNTFRLASCTKLVTSIAALQCVSRGILSLDDPSHN